MAGYRKWVVALCAAGSSTPVLAAETLAFGPPPGWVVRREVPSAKASDAPVTMLLNDQQIRFDPGKIVSYAQLVFRINKSEGLASGNISVGWQPATESVTVNALKIRRGDTIIDVLASGQTFTVLRRESNLDLAMLDGALTANIQPEGLQIGDVVTLATTSERADPILKGHVEALFAGWNGFPIALGSASVSWPSTLDVKFRRSPGLPEPTRTDGGGRAGLLLSERDVQPLIPPKEAPARFRLGRIAEASDFPSWSAVADLMIPLYREASAIPASGPLRTELDRMRTAASPEARAEQALALVQGRVRYVALLMGQGGYVPTNAETTWSRRFGDCKAKSALLLGLLRELGIDAEPVLVNSMMRDVVGDRLPMLGVFDHVIVRARIGGTTYWLDGTRTGDKYLSQVRAAAFGWALPLVPQAQLVRVMPPPLEIAEAETRLGIDASSGIYAPAPVTVERTLRGDEAYALNLALSGGTAAQRSEFFKEFWRKSFDFITPAETVLNFDEKKRELNLKMTGEAKLDWSSGYFHVPDTSLGYSFDFKRSPGPFSEAPVEIAYPRYERSLTTIRLPAGYLPAASHSPAVRQTLAGVEYSRTSKNVGDVMTVEISERALVPEIPYKDGLAAEARLRALSEEGVAIVRRADYRPSAPDTAALGKATPASSKEFIDRGVIRLNDGKTDDAIGDFTKALEYDGKNQWGLANRGLALAWKRDVPAAEKDFAAAEDIDPDNPVAARGRGLIAEIKLKPQEAVDFYTKSLRREPRNDFALTRRGLVLLMLGKPEDALRDLDEAVTANPQSEQALASRAMALAGKREFVRAEADAAAALKINPNSEVALLARGQIAEGQGNFKSAVETYSKVLGLVPDSGMAFARRAAAYRALGDSDKALSDTEQAIKSGFPSSEVRLLRANIFVIQGKMDLVENEAQLLLKENPTAGFAHVAAGKIYARLGKQDAAFKAFDRALELEPTAAYVYVNRAEVRPMADVSGRKEDLDTAFKMDPRDPSILAARSQFLALSGNYTEALTMMDRLLPLSTNKDAVSVQRAFLLAKSGNPSAAERLLTEQRAKATTSGHLNDICWAKATAGLMLDSALEDCREAVRLEPGNREAIDSLAFVLLRKGKLDEAFLNYNRAIEKRASAASLFGRAVVSARRGDAGKAKADRAAALEKSPEIEAEFAMYGIRL